MIQNFQIVGEQVLILFVMIGIGYICGKKQILSKEAIAGITDLVLFIVTPSVIIHTFQREFDAALLEGLLFALIAAVGIHLLNILLAKLVIRHEKTEREKVMRCCIVFSNCGFMALPLQSALLGDLGVFYGAAYIAVFNVFAWSYGLISMSNDKSGLSVKSILLNPGVSGVVIGLIFFLGSIQLPEIIAKPVEYIASLNTPLPMLVIGYHLSTASFVEYKKDMKFYITLLSRLLIAPIITLFGLLVFGLKGDLLISCMISASTPVAALTVMFAHRFGQDSKIAVSLASASTILSIVTLPLIVGFAQLFS